MYFFLLYTFKDVLTVNTFMSFKLILLVYMYKFENTISFINNLYSIHTSIPCSSFMADELSLFSSSVLFISGKDGCDTERHVHVVWTRLPEAWCQCLAIVLDINLYWYLWYQNVYTKTTKSEESFVTKPWNMALKNVMCKSSLMS